MKVRERKERERGEGKEGKGNIPEQKSGLRPCTGLRAYYRSAEKASK